MIEIDGSLGEGGGQILRSSLTLSMLTGQKFCIRNIRKGRGKPGLLRQHLTCCKAAAEISSAKTEGAELGSQTLRFSPGKVRGGDYEFAIGSAGSTNLVFQTILPALATAKEASSIDLRGGTHNPMAPNCEFLERTLFPLLRQMGVKVSSKIETLGFYPAGGGHIRYSLKPCESVKAIHLLERGAEISQQGEAMVCGIPGHVAQRELATLQKELGWNGSQCKVRRNRKTRSSGNVLLAYLEYQNVCETITAIGERGKSAETVASELAKEVQSYLSTDAPVGPHLADQLLLWIAIAGKGSFRTCKPTMHTRSQIDTIQRFLPVRIKLTKEKDTWLIQVES